MKLSLVAGVLRECLLVGRDDQVSHSRVSPDRQKKKKKELVPDDARQGKWWLADQGRASGSGGR